MKRLSVALMLLAAFMLLTATVALGAPKLQAFGTGDVALTGDNSATIDNDVGEYGGVYLNSRSQSGKLLAEVDFSFVSTGDFGGGAPRFSIPIDDLAIPGPTDFFGGTSVAYAFLDVANCGSATVSTESLTCPVFLNTGPSFANWDVFAAAHPTYRIAPGYIPFVIADQAGAYEVEDIELR